jgi:hypothetical protein
VTGFFHEGIGHSVAVADNRICIANDVRGLLVLASLPRVQFTLRIDASPGQMLSLEATTNLAPPVSWTTLLTTNSPASSFFHTDPDVKKTNQTHRFYRIRPE